jgi:hypothetical protein
MPGLIAFPADCGMRTARRIKLHTRPTLRESAISRLTSNNRRYGQ